MDGDPSRRQSVSEGPRLASQGTARDGAVPYRHRTRQSLPTAIRLPRVARQGKEVQADGRKGGREECRAWSADSMGVHVEVPENRCGNQRAQQGGTMHVSREMQPQSYTPATSSWKPVSRNLHLQWLQNEKIPKSNKTDARRARWKLPRADERGPGTPDTEPADGARAQGNRSEPLPHTAVS